MSSESQIRANRKNAQRSTGPKTAAGKSRSSQNSSKHGARSQRMVLFKGEEAYVDLAQGYMDHFKPVDDYQRGLVLEMIRNRLAIDRADRAEEGLLLSESAGKNLTALQFAPTTHVDDNLARDKSEKLAESSELLNEITKPTIPTTMPEEDTEQPASEPLLEVITINDTERAELEILSDNFAQNSQMLELLRRYRTSRENSFYRALHELQRDQALKRGDKVATPIAVDVGINSSGSDAPDQNRSSSGGGN